MMTAHYTCVLLVLHTCWAVPCTTYALHVVLWACVILLFQVPFQCQNGSGTTTKAISRAQFFHPGREKSGAVCAGLLEASTG